jgi:hypothetical protein
MRQVQGDALRGRSYGNGFGKRGRVDVRVNVLGFRHGLGEGSNGSRLLNTMCAGWACWPGCQNLQDEW